MSSPSTSIDTSVTGMASDSLTAKPTTATDNLQANTSTPSSMFHGLASTAAASYANTGVSNNKIMTPGFTSHTAHIAAAYDAASVGSSSVAPAEDVKMQDDSQDVVTSTMLASSLGKNRTRTTFNTHKAKAKLESQDDIITADPISKLGKRKAGLKARDNLTLFANSDKCDIYDSDASDVEKPQQKRKKSLQASKAVVSSAKIGTTQRRGEKGNYIGTHKEDPQGRLKVFAVYYPNGPLNCRVFKEDCTAAERKLFERFFHTKAQAKMENIEFDKILFAHVPNIQNLTWQKQKSHVRDYLATLGIYQPKKVKAEGGKAFELLPRVSSSRSTPVPSIEVASASKRAVTRSSHANPKNFQFKTLPNTGTFTYRGKAPAASPPIMSAEEVLPGDDATPVNYSSDLHVGYWRINHRVLVYAFLHDVDGEVHVGFRCHTDEVPEKIRTTENLLPLGGSFAYCDIDLKDSLDFGREDVFIAHIANTIQTKEAVTIQRAVPEDRPVGFRPEVSMGGIVVDKPTDIHEPESVSSSASQKSAREARSGRVIVNKTVEELNERGTLGVLGLSQEEVMIQDESEQDTTASDSSASSSAVLSSKGKEKEQTSAPISQDEQIRQLKAQLEERDATVAELNKTIGEMNQTAAKQQSERPTTLSDKRIIIGQAVYDIVASGPNAGKLRTLTWTKVVKNRKIYKQWTILSEIKLNLGNTKKLIQPNLTPLVPQIGQDTSFAKIPDGFQAGMLVSDKTIIETPEGTFAKWLLREELPAERRFV